MCFINAHINMFENTDKIMLEKKTTTTNEKSFCSQDMSITTHNDGNNMYTTLLLTSCPLHTTPASQCRHSATNVSGHSVDNNQLTGDAWCNG